MSSSHRPSTSPSTRTQLATPSSTPPTSPSSTSTQTTSPTSTSTPTSSSSPQGQASLTAGIVSIVVILLLACGAIIGYLVYCRRKSRRKLQHGYQRHSTPGGYQAELGDRPATPSRSMKRPGEVDKSHVAARIAPYGSSTNLVPRFNHSPGNEMRIATRRPDGAWEFSNPGSSFNPVGVDEIEPPASASVSMYSPTPTRSTFKMPMTPTTPTKFSSSIHSSFPPTPETPSFPPGLPQATPSLLPSLSPSTPTTPRNVTTFAASSSSTPTPIRPVSQLTTTSMEPPKSPAQIMKEHESRAARLIRQGYDDREFSDEAPPPAYGHDPCHLDPTEEPSLQ